MPAFILIMLLAACPAVATDLYLPALPTIQKAWGLGHSAAGLTLSLFYAAYSVFLLVHGPLSDRHGRRPVLAVGLALFMLGSFTSALAGSLPLMVAGRVAQGVGAAAASGLALALAKDFYQGAKRQKVMAYIGVAVPLCPMIAPFLGAFFLNYASWRFIFIAQGAFTLVPLYGVWKMPEPVKAGAQSPEAGLAQALRRYARLGSNARYLCAAIGFSMMTMPFYAYIAGAPDIYISGFGATPGWFGFFFALNGIAMMGGATLCARLADKFSARRVLGCSVWGMGLAAAAMLVFQGGGLLSFVLCMFALNLFLGMNRPLGNFISLEPVREDVGTASSFLSFLMALFGSLGMFMINLWPSKAAGIGAMAAFGTLTSLLMLVVLRRLGPGDAPPDAPKGKT